MIAKIAQMIIKEAKERTDQDLDVAMMMVLFEVTDMVCDAIKTTKVEKIKNIRLKFKRKE